MTIACNRLQRARAPAGTTAIYQNAGLAVRRFVCGATPASRPFEEAHAEACVALVLSGTYRYRSGLGAGTLIPGSILVGRRCEGYDCSHVDGEGDDNLVFEFDRKWLVGVGLGDACWSSGASATMPPATGSSSVVARAAALFRVGAGCDVVEELAIDVVERSLRETGGICDPEPSHMALRRVGEVVRWVEANLDADCSLQVLAGKANLSPFHFCRSFKRVTGQTLAQFVLGRRLQRAAELLGASSMPVTAVAFEAGFGDLSHFNASFRSAFGETPTGWRLKSAGSRKLAEAHRG